MGFFIIFFLAIFSIIFICAVAINSKRTKVEKKYFEALDAVKQNPNSPDAQEYALAWGRVMVSNHYLTEIALSQDINAATAAATIGEGNARNVTLKTSNDAPDGIAAEIAKLAELQAAGIISADEFDLGKNYLFNHDTTDELAKKIRLLHELKQQGAITQGEFNLKKWDVLAR